MIDSGTPGRSSAKHDKRFKLKHSRITDFAPNVISLGPVVGERLHGQWHGAATRSRTVVTSYDSERRTLSCADLYELTSLFLD